MLFEIEARRKEHAMRTNRLLQANAAFLMFMGGAAAVADATGHFLGKGPLGAVMFRAPLAISSFEAHLLAVILGVVLWTGARKPERRPLHVLAAVIHLVLGGSNLLFFEPAFGSIDMRLFGVIITAFHFAFVIAQTAAALPRLRAPSGVAVAQTT
jgi:hypothetical protein